MTYRLESMCLWRKFIFFKRVYGGYLDQAYKVNDTQDKSSDIGLINICVFLSIQIKGVKWVSKECRKLEFRLSEGCRKSVGGIRREVGMVFERYRRGALLVHSVPTRNASADNPVF